MSDPHCYPANVQLDNPTAIAAHLAQTFASCPSPKPWNTRIVLGCWSAAFLPACLEHLPSFPIALNCFDVSYARQFLRVPNIGFNMYQKVLMGPLARGFLEEARAAKRPVYVWTVNEENLMSWSLRKQLDGVVTDRPEEYRRLAESWTGNGDERIRASQTAEVWMASLVIVLFGWIFKRKYLPGIERVRFDGAVSK